MARIDYFDIESELVSLLRADADLGGVFVTLEEEELQAAELTPWVVVYLQRREAPAEQPIAAGTRTRMRLRFSIWCYEYSLASLADAAQKRDDLIGKVEIALMKNRTLSNKVEYLFLEGGEFETGKTGVAWVSGAEIVVAAMAKATT